MSFVVVGLLIGLWTWVLLPGLLRERRASALDHVNDDDRSLSSLSGGSGGDGAGGRHILVLTDAERVVSARPRSRAELRRRALLARGAFAVAVAVVTGFALGGPWWIAAGAIGAGYAIYLGFVLRLERRLAERRDRLHDLDEERRAREPAPAPEPDDDAVEVAVSDASGILVTGWRRSQTPGA